MSPTQAQALAQLNSKRRLFAEQYPDRWIAVNANGVATAASRFDLLVNQQGIDAEHCVFAFIAVGAWA